MQQRLKLTAASLLFAVGIPVAHAQESQSDFPKTSVSGWTVYGYKQKCWMVQSPAVNGTILSFAFSKVRAAPYIGAENPGWSRIEHMKPYQVQFEMGALKGEFSATGMNQGALGPMTAFTVDDERLDMLAVLRGARRASMTLEGVLLFDMPLGRIGAAVDRFEQCARQLKVGPFRQ